MSVSSVGSFSSSTYLTESDSEIAKLEKQKREIQQMIQEETASKDSEEEKQEKIEQYQLQIQELEMRIQQLKSQQQEKKLATIAESKELEEQANEKDTGSKSNTRIDIRV